MLGGGRSPCSRVARGGGAVVSPETAREPGGGGGGFGAHPLPAEGSLRVPFLREGGAGAAAHPGPAAPVATTSAPRSVPRLFPLCCFFFLLFVWLFTFFFFNPFFFFFLPPSLKGRLLGAGGRKGPAVPASRPQPQETKQPGDKGGRRFLFLPPPLPQRDAGGCPPAPAPAAPPAPQPDPGTPVGSGVVA